MKKRQFKLALVNGNQFFGAEVIRWDINLGYQNKRQLREIQSKISQSFEGLTINGEVIAGSHWEMLP